MITRKRPLNLILSLLIMFSLVGSPLAQAANAPTTEFPLANAPQANPPPGRNGLGMGAAENGNPADAPVHLVDGVNVTNGNLFLSDIHFQFNGVGPTFGFQIAYNSQADPVPTPIGTRWTHSLNWFVDIDPNGDLLVHKGDGEVITFPLRCRQDVDRSGSQVDVLDIGATAEHWGTALGDPNYDPRFDVALPADNQVNILDVQVGAGAFNRFCYQLSQDYWLWNTSQADAVASQIVSQPGGDIELHTREGLIYRFFSPLLLSPTAGKLQSVRDRNDNGYDLLYGLNGLLTTASSTSGMSLAFAYSLSACPDLGPVIETVTDHSGRAVTYRYDPLTCDLTGVERYGVDWRSYSYAAGSLLLTDMDANGAVTTYAYDADSRVISLQRPDTLAAQTYDYGTPGQTEIVDPLGRPTQVLYDLNSKITQIVKGAGGQVIAYAYDSRGNLSHLGGPDGNDYEYDQNGNLVRMATAHPDPDTATRLETIFTYDDCNQVVTTTDAMGNVTENVYDPATCQLTAMRDAEGNQTQFINNARGQPETITDALGRQTHNVYDANGNLIQTTDPAGNVTQMAYDELNRKEEEIDAEGLKTRFEYDDFDRQTSITAPNDGRTVMVYDNVGNLVGSTDPDGQTTRYTYDGRGNKISVTDNAGHTTHYTYDDGDRLVSVTDPTGRVTRIEYDSQDRPIRVVGNALGTEPQVTELIYDDENLNRTIVNALEQPTRFELDRAGRVIAVTDPLSGTIQYDYDLAGNLAVVTDTLGHVERQTYDSAGRKVAETDARGNTTRYQYDAAGNVIQVTNARGYTTTFQYDHLDRLIAVRDSLEGVTRMAYDARGNLAVVTDTTGLTTTLTYDLNGNLASITNGAGDTTWLEHSLAGRRTALQSPLGGRVEFVLDELGRVARERRRGFAPWQTSPRGQLKPVPTRRTDPIVVEWHGYLVVTGGHAQGSGDCQVATELYDVANDTWSAGADQPGKGTCFGGDGAVLGDRLYAAGDGLKGDNNLFIYDLTADTWMTDTLPVQLGYGNEVVASGGSLYFFRAFDGDLNYSNANQFWRYTPPLGGGPGGTWTRLADLPNKVIHRAAWTHNGKIYTAGGVDGSGQGTAQVAVYDPAGDAWSQDPALFAPLPAGGWGAADAYDPLTGQFYWAGGANETSSITTNRFWRYNPLSNLWETLDALPHPTYRFEAAWADGTFIAAGGFDPQDGYAGVDWLQRWSACPGCLEAATSFEYDAAGNRISMTDADGSTWRYGYDEFDRLIATTDPLSNTTTYTYDALGNLLSTEKPNTCSTTYTYDALSRITRLDYSDGSYVTQEYDGLGNVLEVASFGPDGLVTSQSRFQYDERNEITQVSGLARPGLPYTLTYQYDQVGNPTHKSLLLPDLNAPVEVDLEWDANNRLVRITRQEGGRVASVEKEYDPAGRLSVSRFSSESSLSSFTFYDYDHAGRIQSIRHCGDEACLSLLAQYDYTYDANGNRTSERVFKDGSEMLVQYSYDGLDRLVREVRQQVNPPGPAQYDITYTYDPVGNRLSSQDAVANKRTDTFYDRAHQTKSVLKFEGGLLVDQLDYTYDAAGNLIQRSNVDIPPPDVTPIWAVGYPGSGAEGGAADDKLELAQAQPVNEEFQYNCAGQQVAYIDHVSGETQLYFYDALGNKILADSLLGSQAFIYDGPNVVAEYDVNPLGTPALAATYLFGQEIDEPLARIDAATGDPAFYLTDALGSVRQVVDALGAVVNDYEYDAWGQVVSELTGLPNNILFTGRWRDPASELYDFRTRVYDPTDGRFLQRDPIYEGLILAPCVACWENPLELDSVMPLYAYVGNNPATYTDPTGEQWWFWYPWWWVSSRPWTFWPYRWWGWWYGPWGWFGLRWWWWRWWWPANPFWGGWWWWQWRWWWGGWWFPWWGNFWWSWWWWGNHWWWWPWWFGWGWWWFPWWWGGWWWPWWWFKWRGWWHWWWWWPFKWAWWCGWWWRWWWPWWWHGWWWPWFWLNWGGWRLGFWLGWGWWWWPWWWGGFWWPWWFGWGWWPWWGGRLWWPWWWTWRPWWWGVWWWGPWYWWAGWYWWPWWWGGFWWPWWWHCRWSLWPWWWHGWWLWWHWWRPWHWFWWWRPWWFWWGCWGWWWRPLIPAGSWLREVGDAPDSTNHDGALMTAYPLTGPPGVQANFPTVYDPALGPPYGPMHRAPYADAYLGTRVSSEYDADRLWDWDGLTNLDPLGDAPDRDGYDDGVNPASISLVHCIQTSFLVTVTVRTWSPRPRYLNTWIDWNQDGDWDDALNCFAVGDAAEWAVQNQKVPLGPGIWVVPVTNFLPWISGLNRDYWMRVSLTEQPYPAGSAGAGPLYGFAYGETEDYLVTRP